MHRKHLSLIVGITIPILVSLLSQYGYLPHAPATTTKTSQSKQYHVGLEVFGTSSRFHVVKVVDGDTVDISQGEQGEEREEVFRLRLIGINTPETVDPRRAVQCFGKEASNKAKELLTGSTVRVELDSSQGMYDKYDRVLAYLILPDGTIFNEQMIREGYAYEYTYNAPYKYQKQFKTAEQKAKKEEVGLWSAQTCDGKK